MKIAIIIPGGLPVPPKKGGAVENLIYTIIRENEICETPINIDLYGIYDEFKGNYSIVENYTKYVLSKVIDTNNKNIFYRINNKLKKEDFLSKVIKEIKGKEYDYIIVENRPNYIKRLKQNNKSKIILHMHNEHLTDKINYSEEIKLCDKIMVVSNYIKSTIINKYNIADDKVYVLHNGIDEKKFNILTNQQKKKSLREKYGLAEDDFVILFSGRLTKEKGVLELINAFKEFKSINNIRLLIVGSNWFSQENKSDFIHEIERQSKSISEKVIFTGYVDYNEVNEVYSIADISVLPSIWNDPFPLTVLECMGVGLPVISTLSGGIPEMINEDCGVLIPIDDNIQQNIYKEILKFYNKEYDIETMSKKSRENIEQCFNNGNFYKEFIKILN